MEMSNCKRCKKLFPRINEPICDNCLKLEEEQFITVKEFLHENSKATILEIADATGCPAKRIIGWLREGRLEILSESGELKCRNCSKPINSGNYCDPCFIEVNQEIDGMFSGTKGKKNHGFGAGGSGATMHTRKR